MGSKVAWAVSSHSFNSTQTLLIILCLPKSVIQTHKKLIQYPVCNAVALIQLIRVYKTADI